MDAAVEAVSNFRIDQRSEFDQTAECRLHMTAGAAESVVEIEVTERGVEIVAPHQHHDAAAKPDAFGIASRTIDRLGRLDEFVRLLLALTGNVGRRHGRICRRLLILCANWAALGQRAANTQQQSKAWNGETTQNRRLEPEHQSTHKVPDKLAARQF